MSQYSSLLYQKYMKRLLDVFLSFIALVILSPIFILVWIGLSISNRGAGAFFLQERPGKDERIFKIIKFKTMSDLRDEAGNLLPDAERLTKVGSVIRKTSLDEIPQLINVLIGDMSLIGPRPLLVKYLPLYNSHQRRRHEVKPGITGWAQVNGRNNIKWEQKFDYDVWYVDNISFLLDLKIMLRTIKKTVKRVDISQDGHATVETFRGSK